jgi:hypothetical protein
MDSFDVRIEIPSYSQIYSFGNGGDVYDEKGQLSLQDKSVQSQVKFIHQLFGMVA